MSLLTDLRAQGLVSPIDVHFSQAMLRLAREEDDTVALAAALASRQTRSGHVCLEIAALAGTRMIGDDGQPLADRYYPALEPWRSALEKSCVVSDGSRFAPLVLDAKHRLYLRRYWEHEQKLAREVLRRAQPAPAPVEPHSIRTALDALFPALPGEVNWQRVAAQIAVLGHLTIISGGPGTGKTSTVVGILALLIEDWLARGQPAPRVELLAPTGKAAARLIESVQRAREKLQLDTRLAAHLPAAASTIHRALRPVGGFSTRFHHDETRPLRCDIVVVDEASMVDVALMRRLFDAIPPSARVLLLGDRDQLASIEAGAVLSDLCGARTKVTYSTRASEQCKAVFGESLPQAGTSPEEHGPALDDAVVMLTKSYRFGQDSGIGRLAEQVRAGDIDAVEALLREGSDDVRFYEVTAAGPPLRRLRPVVVRGFEKLLLAESPREALHALEGFRILCAHRRGNMGVETMNQWAEHVLAEAGLIRPRGVWYFGRPLLVTQNDYQLGLFNGDVGMTLGEGTDSLRAFFLDSEGRPRPVPPARMPRHETAFSMSIHKSQGSELDEIVVFLAHESSPVLCRELLYTAVTRARYRVTLVGSLASVRQAVRCRASRSSGLADALRPRNGTEPA